MYASKRAYYDNNGTEEICYPISHKNSIFIKDDESETLGTYITQNDMNILNVYKTLTKAIGNGIISGLEVSAQTSPNMTIQVSDGTILNNGNVLNINGKSLIIISPSDASRARKDIIYLDSDLSTIKYLAGNYSVITAGSETYTIDVNAKAEIAGSNTYNVSNDFVAEVAGSNTYSLTTNFIANDTVTFEDIVFTAVASGATGNQFNIGANVSDSMVNLVSAFNNNTTINSTYNCTSYTDTITIVEKNAGGGNTPSNMTTNGTGKITNGTPIESKTADTINFENITFTASNSIQDSTNFKIGSDVMGTANNIFTMLNANTNITNLYTITESSNVITITEKNAGTGHTPSNMICIGIGRITNGTPIASKSADTITINGIIFTATIGSSSEDKFIIGIDENATASNLATTLNSNTAINSFYQTSVSNNIVTLTEIQSGNGNTPSLATTTGIMKITNGIIVNSNITIPLPPSVPSGGILLSELQIDKGMTVIQNTSIKDRRSIITELVNKQDKINFSETNKISIIHNGNCYPFARLLYLDSKYGKVTEMTRELEYYDKNTISIYVENKYIGTNGTLTKITDNEFHMIYDEGTIIVMLNYLT